MTESALLVVHAKSVRRAQLASSRANARDLTFDVMSHTFE